MHTIGIDMSKATFHASFAGERGQQFPNTRKGYRSFIEALRANACQPRDTIIGVEATGAYHWPFCVTLTEHGWTVKILNLLLVSRLGKTALRTAKTDGLDAALVRRAAESGGYVFTDSRSILALKALFRERTTIVRAGSPHPLLNSGFFVVHLFRPPFPTHPPSLTLIVSLLCVNDLRQRSKKTSIT